MSNIKLSSYSKGTLRGYQKNKPLKPLQSGEAGVTLCQIASENMKAVLDGVTSLKNFIQNVEVGNGEISKVSRGEMIRQHLLKLEGLAQSAQFSGERLLNGDSGIMCEVKGEGLSFVRGGSGIGLSSEDLIPVYVDKLPEKSSLLSRVEISDRLVKQEKAIYIRIAGQLYEFDLKMLGSVSELLKNFRNFCLSAGIDISFSINQNGHGLLRYNQPGDSFSFEALSLTTDMFHDGTRNFLPSAKGSNISARIGSMQTIGIGSFIIGGAQGNPSNGLILSYKGAFESASKEVGGIKLSNGSWVYRGSDSVEQVTLPNLRPTVLGAGIHNLSGFSNLVQISAESPQQKSDSLLMLNWVIQDIGFMLDKLKVLESGFVEKSLEALKSRKMDWLPEGASITSSQEAAKVMMQLNQRKKFLGSAFYI